jgi:signal transduction histidine kinase
MYNDEKNFVRFEIRDTGIGIESSKLESIFSIFGKKKEDLLDDHNMEQRSCKLLFSLTLAAGMGLSIS